MSPNNRPELDVGRERVWKKLRLYSYDNGGFVNWWEYFGYHREPIEMNRLLKWNNPPDFSQLIPLNGRAIDRVPPAL